MINASNRISTHRANGIDYIFEYLEDAWIAIYEFRDGCPWRPLIQACDEERTLDYISMREPVPFGTMPLVP